MEKIDIVVLEFYKCNHLWLLPYLTLNIFRASARAPTASLREKMMLMDFASFESISEDCKEINQVKKRNKLLQKSIVKCYKARLQAVKS